MKNANYKNIKVVITAHEDLTNLKLLYSYSNFSDLISDMCTESVKRGFVTLKSNRNTKGDIFKFIESQVGRTIAVLTNHEKFYLRNLVTLDSKMNDLIIISRQKFEHNPEVYDRSKLVSKKDYDDLLYLKNIFESEADSSQKKLNELEDKLLQLKKHFKKKSNVFASGSVYEAVVNPDDFDNIFNV